MVRSTDKQLTVEGKWFCRDGKRLAVRAVTFGPFPDPQPCLDEELVRIKEAGFHAIRIYDEPTDELLDAALRHGLMVMVGAQWTWQRVFRGGARDEAVFIEAKKKLRSSLLRWGAHPAVVAVYVANEISPDLARWMGVAKTKESLEELIDLVHAVIPGLLAAYASFPSSEFLEPANADFTAMNVYLERRGQLADYLPRLHHLAGDRPVVISEFGLDTRHAGEQRQVEVMRWFYEECHRAGVAGTTWFAWSDSWFAGGEAVVEWAFGLTRPDGSEKPALACVGATMDSLRHWPKFSVIICVYNGEERIARAVESLALLDYPNVECLVVDDGSVDGTREMVRKYQHVRLIECAHGGLSAARNAGAAAASGEVLAYMDDDCEADPQWLRWLAQAYQDQGCDACGGPNLPPYPAGEDEAVVASAPGAPSHVMLDDVTAEHLPGCNLTVKKSVFEAIGGFRQQFRVAGDDVDFCWRLRDAGYRMGFHGAAFVWHRRRTSLFRYFKQQWGYGKAEALLLQAHPEKFSKSGGAHWQGCVYHGGAVGGDAGSVIYHGPAALTGYQQVRVNMMPQRALPAGYQSWKCLLKLTLSSKWQPRIRRWARWWYGRKVRAGLFPLPSLTLRNPLVMPRRVRELDCVLPAFFSRQRLIEEFMVNGWQVCGGEDLWDMQLGKARLLLAREILDSKWIRVRIRAVGADRLIWSQIHAQVQGAKHSRLHIRST